MGYTQPLFNVRKITGGYSIYPDGVTTDDLTISSNPVDTYPKISLLGNGSLYLYLYTDNYLTIYNGADSLLFIKRTGTDTIIGGATGTANNDIAILPNGSGVLKFGTYTAGAATDSTGYITIKDAAGNTRKLMVQA